MPGVWGAEYYQLAYYSGTTLVVLFPLMIVWRLRYAHFAAPRLCTIRLLFPGRVRSYWRRVTFYELMNNMHYQDLANRLQLDATLKCFCLLAPKAIRPQIFMKI